MEDNELTQRQQEETARLVRFVVENGRVAQREDNPQLLDIESLIDEVRFEAGELGYDEDIASAMGRFAQTFVS